MEHIETCQTELQKHHDELCQSQRWGGLNGNGEVTWRDSQGCYGQLHYSESRVPSFSLMYFVFHGSGPELTMEELLDAEKCIQKIAASPRAWNEFQGTEKTQRWVDYLLSQKSPWRALLPFLVDPRSSAINNSGWIFKDLVTIPQKLLYNFLMAQRFPWEQCEQFATWLFLCDHGVEPTQALFISCNFTLRKGVAKDLSGPWDVMYPWSFLEGCTLDGAGRFIKGVPGNPSGSMAPNVFALWQTTSFEAECMQQVNAMSEQTELSLAEIIVAVEEAVDKQSKVW